MAFLQFLMSLSSAAYFLLGIIITQLWNLFLEYLKDKREIKKYIVTRKIEKFEILLSTIDTLKNCLFLVELCLDKIENYKSNADEDLGYYFEVLIETNKKISEVSEKSQSSLMTAAFLYADFDFDKYWKNEDTIALATEWSKFHHYEESIKARQPILNLIEDRDFKNIQITAGKLKKHYSKSAKSYSHIIAEMKSIIKNHSS
jgi:uncharacterized protein YlxP (DUF503 family)